MAKPVPEEPELEVTRVFHFPAAHQLRGVEGPCSRPHGHTFRLEITVAGRREETGMVLDFSRLEELVRDRILDRLDHSFLNEVMEENPTVENLCLFIARRWEEDVAPLLPGLRLRRVEVWESPFSSAALSFRS